MRINESRKTATLLFIVLYKLQHGGVSPAVRDISEGIQVSEPAILRYLERLEFEGKITRISDEGSLRTHPRTIEVPGIQLEYPGTTVKTLEEAIRKHVEDGNKHPRMGVQI